MNKKKVYISGPIAHYDIEERKVAFRGAALHLAMSGYSPINPFDNGLPDNADWRKHMKVDIGMLLRCDAIYMMEDWYLSKGCKLELDVASSCGIDVIFDPDHLATL